MNVQARWMVWVIAAFVPLVYPFIRHQMLVACVSACAILTVILVLNSPSLRIVFALIFVGFSVYFLITGEHIGRGRATPFEVRVWAGVYIFVGLTVIAVTIRQMLYPRSTDNDQK